ncbi:hypothetical protein [Ruegeria arenilitoris]|uniref:hypothetical protein n=1 Tax=Ruegeria arenilitoris TaxID=1173585 RepID=UPI0014799F05
MSAKFSCGGTFVGRLSDLTPIEAGAVLYLRLWSQCAKSCANAVRDFAIALSTSRGRAAISTLDHMLSLCAQHGRRTFVQHGTECGCLGAEENCFAQMIAAGAEGECEDAMTMASLIVRLDYSPALSSLAEEFGIALR